MTDKAPPPVLKNIKNISKSQIYFYWVFLLLCSFSEHRRVGDFYFLLSCCIGLKGAGSWRTVYRVVNRVGIAKTTKLQSSKIKWSGVTNNRIKFAHVNFNWVIFIYQMLQSSATLFLLFSQTIPDSDHRRRLGWPNSFFNHSDTKSGPRRFGLYNRG